jgi:hypothetical protein
VSDLGYDQRLPYNESQDRFDFYSDGSTLLIGPLDFVPRQSSRSSWTRITIPDAYSACDEIEVFVAGARLKKDSYVIFNPQAASFSPDGDEVVEAEFSVDGITNYVRLTTPVRAGTRITVVRRTGKIWYDRGVSTASAGITFLDNLNTVAKFIAAKTSELPTQSRPVED